jgi:hypothetical protein
MFGLPPSISKPLPVQPGNRYHHSMRKIITRGSWLGILLLSVGCGSTHSYDVLVTNKLADPVTVWLTKSEGPYEAGWYPPEEVEMGITGTKPPNAHIILPGETGEAKSKGEFDPGVQAVVRVYRAQTMEAMLSMDRGMQDRLDLPIMPGKTDIDIVKVDGALQAQPHASARP